MKNLFEEGVRGSAFSKKGTPPQKKPPKELQMREVILCKYGEIVLKGANKAHFEAVEKYGVSPIHRKSFLKKRGLV